MKASRREDPVSNHGVGKMSLVPVRRLPLHLSYRLGLASHIPSLEGPFAPNIDFPYVNSGTNLTPPPPVCYSQARVRGSRTRSAVVYIVPSGHGDIWRATLHLEHNGQLAGFWNLTFEVRSYSGDLVARSEVRREMK